MRRSLTIIAAAAAALTLAGPASAASAYASAAAGRAVSVPANVPKHHKHKRLEAAGVAGVSLAQVGNDLLLAGQGGDHDELVYYQAVGSSSWPGLQVSSDGTVYSQASFADLTETSGGVRTVHFIAMVAEGPDETLNFWWQPLSSIGSGQWNQEVLGGPGTAVSAPAIVAIGGDVAVAAQGANHTLSFFWQQIGASRWNSLLNQEQGLVYSAPTMARLASAPDTLGIVFTQSDTTDFYVQQTTSSFGQPWPGTYAIDCIITGGAASGGPWASTITGLDNEVTAVTTQGPDNSLDSCTTTDPPNFSLTTDSAYPGTVYSNVSVAQLGGGVAAAAAEGDNANLNFYWRTYSALPWHLESVGDAGTDLSAPQVIAFVNSAGKQFVAIATEGPKGSADFYWQSVGSSTWQTVPFGAGTFEA